MAAAATLVLAPQASERVAALWRALAAAGCGDGMAALGYVPHVTLLAWPEAEADAVAAALARMRPLLPARLACATLGVAPGVLWLGVVTTPALLELHAALAAALPDGIHPHYQPGAWMPHVTLAMNLAPAQLGPAVAVAAPLLEPFAAPVAAIEAVAFPPVRVVARIAA